MATRMYVINTLSNMHVGSGEVNYGVIDNLIQRDSVTNLPNINSSGLKGAIREYFKGNEDLVSDKVPFLMATSDEILQELITKMKFFNCEEATQYISHLSSLLDHIKTQAKGADFAYVFDNSLQDAIIEEVSIRATYPSHIQLEKPLMKLLGDRLVILSHKYFSILSDDNHLPVLSRNNLENGQSANLWYEQVLPRYSRLYFMLMDGNAQGEYLKKFRDTLCTPSTIIQIGANASIGYGYCQISELSPF